jgi:hypothetical protein
VSDLNSQFHRVIDYNPAAQAVQGMESRGDFNYKGIYRFFTTISEWTEKFLANKVLPNAEQLGRDIALDKEKIDFFIHELCFKQNPPILKKIVTIEFELSDTRKSPNLATGLRRNTVFARPSTLDAGSSQRYINGCNERSVQSIKRAIAEKRERLTGEPLRDFIFQKINQNKLAETYASNDITNLVNCPFDTTKTLKELTVNAHLKPILKKLVDEKVLLFFRNEKAPKSINKSIFLYNNKDEVLERIEVYVNYMKKTIVPQMQKIGVLGTLNDEEYNDFSGLAGKILTFIDDAYGDQKVVLEELTILGSFYDQYREEIKKKEAKEKILEVITLLENSGRLVDLKTVKVNGQIIDPELIPQILTHPSILHTEYDDGSSLFEFVLHKSCATLAVDLAKKVYISTGNDTDIRILNRMNISTSVDETIKKDFNKIEMESLFKYLPFLTRMWRTLLGNIFVTQQEADEIRARKESEQKKRIVESKAKQIAKEKSKLIEERMKQIDDFESAPGLKTEITQAVTEERKLSLEEEQQVKEIQTLIISILDSAWDAKLYPDREYVLSNLRNGMNEDQLVMFLKKHSGKDIMSYQIKSKSNKYKWPILISRNYIKRNGKRLLDTAKKESDKERSSPTPDQDKFDIYASLEDFLTRLSQK